MSEKVRDFFRQNIGYFVVVIVSAIYVLTALISVSSTNKTIVEILADGMIALMLGIFINRVFELQGVLNGEMSDKMRETLSLHSKAVMMITPKRSCLYENIQGILHGNEKIYIQLQYVFGNILRGPVRRSSPQCRSEHSAEICKPDG